jgi:hypothetical protein
VNFVIPKGKQIWPAETRAPVSVLALHYGALDCAPLRSVPEQKHYLTSKTANCTYAEFEEMNLQRRCYTNLIGRVTNSVADD